MIKFTRMSSNGCEYVLADQKIEGKNIIYISPRSDNSIYLHGSTSDSAVRCAVKFAQMEGRLTEVVETAAGLKRVFFDRETQEIGLEMDKPEKRELVMNKELKVVKDDRGKVWVVGKAKVIAKGVINKKSTLSHHEVKRAEKQRQNA